MSAAHGHGEDLTGWATAIEAALPGIERCCVSRVVVYAKTVSTQDAAWRHRPRTPEAGGVAVLASVQTDGRGRLGRRWEDGEARTLPLSFALCTGLSDAALSARAGLAALDACRLQAPGSDLRIKWPNDVVAWDATGERKLAGVLIERRDGAAIIGVGVNVSQTPEELAGQGLLGACSLAVLGGKTGRLALAVDLVAAMSRWLAADDDAVRAHWAAHDAMAGTRRAFLVDNERVDGVVTGVDPLGVITVDGRRLPVDRVVTEPVCP